MLRKFAYLQFWLLLAALLAASLQRLPPGGLPTSDKLLHMLAYTALALSARLAYPTAPRALVLWLALMAFSIAIEFGQMLVPGRSCDVLDMLANGIGLLVGLTLYHLPRRVVN